MTIFHIVHMVVIDTQCSLESFRRFIIESTCSSYIPESYASDYEIFAERDADLGSIYVEAADKQTLKKIRDVTFVNARSVLGVIYNSKSGNTSLKWRQTQKYDGKVTGDASSNSLSNMAAARVITLKWVEDYVREKSAIRSPTDIALRSATMSSGSSDLTDIEFPSIIFTIISCAAKRQEGLLDHFAGIFHVHNLPPI